MFKRSNGIRGFIKNMDFWLAVLTVTAAVFGIVMISSAGGEDGRRSVCGYDSRNRRNLSAYVFGL